MDLWSWFDARLQSRKHHGKITTTFGNWSAQLQYTCHIMLHLAEKVHVAPDKVQCVLNDTFEFRIVHTGPPWARLKGVGGDADG